MAKIIQFPGGGGDRDKIIRFPGGKELPEPYSLDKGPLSERRMNTLLGVRGNLEDSIVLETYPALVSVLESGTGAEVVERLGRLSEFESTALSDSIDNIRWEKPYEDPGAMEVDLEFMDFMRRHAGK